MGAVFKRELKSYFITSIGYIFMAIFFIMSGAIFWLFTLDGGSGSFQSFFLMQMFTFIVIIPILTMKLFSEEKKMKTDIALLTSPVGLTKIVLGKFFAAATLFAITFAISCIPCGILYLYSEPNTASLLTNILGILFIGMAFIAIGMFISSLTENQIVAAIVTIFIILFSLVMNFLVSYISVYAVRFVVDWFSFYTRFLPFTQGVMSIESILYFISITAVFIFLTVRVHETRRWK